MASTHKNGLPTDHKWLSPLPQTAKGWLSGGGQGTTQNAEPDCQAWVSHYTVTFRWLSSAPPLAQIVPLAEAAESNLPRRP